MSIITVPRVKELLSISDQTKDDAILQLIPSVREDIVALANNTFSDVPLPAFRTRRAGAEPFFWVPSMHDITSNDVHLFSAQLQFVKDNPPQIIDPNGGWLDSDFIRALDILVWGSLYNDGFYTVSDRAADAPTATILTLLGSSEAGQKQPRDFLEDETSGQFVRIFRVRWAGPQQGIDLIAAEMIGYHLHRQAQFAAETGELAGVISERLGDHSVTYASGNGVRAYPASITDRLDSVKRPVFF